MAEFEIIDRHGRGGRVRHVEKFADDERAVIVNAHGFPAGFRPGFCFVDSEHRDAAAQSYLQRKIDLHNASALHVDHNPTPSLDKLQAIADASRRSRRVCSWERRRHTTGWSRSPARTRPRLGGRAASPSASRSLLPARATCQP
jgi:hypothetical protein